MRIRIRSNVLVLTPTQERIVKTSTTVKISTACMERARANQMVSSSYVIIRLHFVTSYVCDVSGFECVCEEGWSVNLATRLCSTQLCDDSLCMNEGVCSTEGGCECRNYDFGQNCETRAYTHDVIKCRCRHVTMLCFTANLCGLMDRDCNNRGTCNVTSGTCVCDSDVYSGDDCGTQTCRRNFDCLNGGVCQEDSSSYD